MRPLRRWLGGRSEVSAATLQALLPRAEAAVRQDLQRQVTALTARMEHNLALDLARIGDYYDELTTDLERRRARVPEDDVARRQNMAEKLTGLAAERAAKLADARDRYGIRVDLELVNVLLISQPKVIMPVTISNRTVSITRTVVWDPLLHRLEPLVCEAPGEGLHLCTGGHLAHAACLAPQCIDCKRAFCQLCAKQVSVCVVCQQPVCQASLITCPTCRRGTCHQHRELCHAANGEPAVLAPPAPLPSAPPAPPPSQPAKGKKIAAGRRAERQSQTASQSAAAGPHCADSHGRAHRSRGLCN